MSSRPERLGEGCDWAIRMQIGSEICMRAMPAPGDMARFAAVRPERPVTLVTPFLPQDDLPLFRAWVEDFLAAGGRFGEVVVNDWGAFRLLGRLDVGAELVLGRHLVPQLRDPGLARWEDGIRRRLSAAFLGDLAVPFMSPEDWTPFLRERGVGRIEVSALAVPVAPPGIEGLRCSLHVPFVPLTASRFCTLAAREDGPAKPGLPQAGSCRERPCRRGPLRLRDAAGNEPLYLRGRSLSYAVAALPPRRGGFDRLVLDLDAFDALTSPVESQVPTCASS